MNNKHAAKLSKPATRKPLRSVSKDISMDELVSLFFSFSRVMRESLAKTKDPESTSFLHTKTLAFIDEKKAPAMRDIAGCLMIASPTTTTIIDRLVALNQVSRVNDAKDRRVIRLEITPTGKKVLESGMKELRSNVRKMLGILDDKERKELAAIINKLVN